MRGARLVVAFAIVGLAIAGRTSVGQDPPIESEARALREALDRARDRDARDAALAALASFVFANDRALAPVASIASRIELERRSRHDDEARLSNERRALAQRLIEDRRASLGLAPRSKESWAARLERAREATRAEPLVRRFVDERGASAIWRDLAVTRLDAQGFRVASKDHALEASFGEEPAFAFQVLARARRSAKDDRARDIMDDARLALELGEERIARELFTEHARLAPGAGTPDLEKIRAARPFPGPAKTTRESEGVSRLELSVGLDSPADRELFSTTVLRWNVLSTKVAVAKGRLSVSDPTDSCWAQTARAFDLAPGELSLSCGIDTQEAGQPFAGLLLEQPRGEWRLLSISLDGSQKSAIVALDKGEAPRASRKRGRLIEAPLEAARGLVSVTIGLGRDGKPRASIQGHALAIETPALAPLQAIPVFGNAGGYRGSFAEIALSLAVNDAWLRKLHDEHEHVSRCEISKAFAPGELDARVAPAPRSVDSIVAAASGDFDDGSPEEEIARAQRVLELLPGNADALARRSLAFLQVGKVDRARDDARAALEARPDSARALLARARVALGLRETSPELERAARDDLELAEVLAGDKLARAIAADRKALEGPFAFERTRRRVTAHYVVLTDTDDATSEAVASTAEDAFARFARAFGAPARWRRPDVLVFDTRAAFEAWADTVLWGSGKTSGGFYDPFHDQLCVFQPEHDPDGAWTRCVTVHEAFHQFAYQALPRLPVWLDEGLAESFGIEVAYGGSASVRAFGIEETLEKSRGRSDWRRFFALPYAEFHAHGVAGGQKDEHAHYARALIAASILREGEGALAGVLARLLKELEEADPELGPRVSLSDEEVDALEKRFVERARRELARERSH